MEQKERTKGLYCDLHEAPQQLRKTHAFLHLAASPMLSMRKGEG